MVANWVQKGFCSYSSNFGVGLKTEKSHHIPFEKHVYCTGVTDYKKFETEVWSDILPSNCLHDFFFSSKLKFTHQSLFTNAG